MARTFYKVAASLSELFTPEMKMAIFPNWLGAMSKLSEERGFRIKVKMFSLFIMLRESRAVISSPAYSARMVLMGMKAVETK